ncbi:MAG: hypothetical protein EU549_01380 [Promethearchaeota archaeon]|nr:MAG: hypothetical protein EU549_01380 [Candidatus Lokiarchaeota archaeon]
MDKFSEVLKEIAKNKNKSISLKQFKTLDGLFDKRFWKGLKLSIQNNVKKYIFLPSKRIVWIVSSESRDYYTLDNFFCNCKDFFINIVSRREIKYCKHLIAKLLSISLDNYDSIEIADDRYKTLIDEWRAFEKE